MLNIVQYTPIAGTTIKIAPVTSWEFEKDPIFNEKKFFETVMIPHYNELFNVTINKNTDYLTFTDVHLFNNFMATITMPYSDVPYQYIFSYYENSIYRGVISICNDRGIEKRERELNNPDFFQNTQKRTDFLNGCVELEKEELEEYELEEEPEEWEQEIKDREAMEEWYEDMETTALLERIHGII